MIDLLGSLRTRIVFALTASSLILSAAWGMGAISALRLSEDGVLRRQLERIAEDYGRRVEADGEAAWPQSAFVTSYRDAVELPPELAQWGFASSAVGFHEFTEAELHVAVLDTGVVGAARFLVFDVAGIEAPSSEDAFWIAGLTALGLLIALGAMAIGLLIGRLSVEPMVRLAGIVAEVDPASVSEADRARVAWHRFGRNEAGLLADAIERMVARMGAFAERERSFTAAASHELRTPVTVIRGALELLAHADLSTRTRRVLERISGANANMHATIEMFLSLARESNGLVEDEEVQVMAVVEKAVEDCRPLLCAKQGLADIQTDADPVFEGHALAFETVVGNLVRNAIEHGPDEPATIVIRVGSSELVVRNRSNGGPASIRPPSAGAVRGLGLEIVNRLCDHNGWSFGLTEEDGETTARLSWRRRPSETEVEAHICSAIRS